MQDVTYEPQLLRISELSQDLSVGLGQTVGSVRTLTCVSLTVTAGELVVLSGTRGAGERALLSVIAGDRRGVTGSCTVHPSAAVRLLRIHAESALALAQEWARANHWRGHRDALNMNRRALYLLDVVAVDATLQTRGHRSAHAPKPWHEANRSALSVWCERCQERGGAIVMAAGHAFGSSLFTHALRHQKAFVFGSAPEVVVNSGTWSRSEPADRASVFERPVAPSPVRVVVMHSGRLAPTVQLDVRDLQGW